MIHAHVAARAYGESDEKGLRGRGGLSVRVKTSGRRRGRRRGLVWVTGAVAFVFALIYWEQTALLYVLSTLAMTVLLLVVAFSDLEGRDREGTEAVARKDLVD